VENPLAKNYLAAEELDVLNRVVTAYLEFAELQALDRKPMYMRDWIAKLDDFLRLGGRDILTHAGQISHEDAVKKSELEFESIASRNSMPLTSGEGLRGSGEPIAEAEDKTKENEMTQLLTSFPHSPPPAAL